MFPSIDVAPVPRHVALIMDGNRRWARAHGLPVAEGYRRGVAALRETIRAALENGVERITVYGFSTENWRRDNGEVGLLMQLFAACARGERAALMRGGVRVELVGDVEAFAGPVKVALYDLVAATKQNTRLTLALALNYSGRSELVRAAGAIARAAADGKIDPECVDERTLRDALYAPDAPDPDLLIRTGAEYRISNFLLFQSAYTELLTLPLMWPEFDGAAFRGALRTYGDRCRRYGA